MAMLRKKKLTFIIAVIMILSACYLWVQRDFKAYCAQGAFVLEYHAIGEHPDWPADMVVPKAAFERHLQYLQEQGYAMVTVAELQDRFDRGEDVSRYIALSFDDGYVDNYEKALPLLKKYHAKATFLVINKDIGGDIYMNNAQLQQMQRDGMEIGSHTFSHNPLADIDTKYLEWELGVAKYDLERRLLPDTVVRTLAYPCGSYNEAVMAGLRKYGYRAALTGNQFLNMPELVAQRPMELNRLIVLDNGKKPHVFAGMLRRAYWRSYLQSKGIVVPYL